LNLFFSKAKLIKDEYDILWRHAYHLDQDHHQGKKIRFRFRTKFSSYEYLLEKFNFWPSLLFNDFIKQQVSLLTEKMKKKKKLDDDVVDDDDDDDDLKTMLKFLRKMKSPLSILRLKLFGSDNFLGFLLLRHRRHRQLCLLATMMMAIMRLVEQNHYHRVLLEFTV
jgi:hypothetical protein